MADKKKENLKAKLHPRNKHRERYDFKQLVKSCPDLATFVKPNKYGDESINFFDPEAVKMLNKALLKHFYNIEFWDIPTGYLCPPIPGRADYIHHIADLLRENYDDKKQAKRKIKCLDIGVGSSCVYPIIGVNEYGWTFVGSEIDTVATDAAIKIIETNSILKGKVEIRIQPDKKAIFQNIIKNGEHFDLAICNPPFHSSAEEAKAGTVRKLRNLKKKKITKPTLNFGGQQNELWIEGGEIGFVQRMIQESKQFATSCNWFSTLISKQSNLKPVNKALKNASVADSKTIQMGQGNKTSRIVAWKFK